MTHTTHVLYLHGFRSSPQSAKAQLMAKWLAREHSSVYWACPQLPASPLEAAAAIRLILKNWPADSSTVIGSSLGGFYATWAASEHRSAAVVLNPAVHPARDLAAYIGIHPCWHDPAQHIEIKPVYMQEIKTLYVGSGLDFLTESFKGTTLSQLSKMPVKKILSYERSTPHSPRCVFFYREKRDV
jgi:predicted esterase YcpF (UPF0227 family)